MQFNNINQFPTRHKTRQTNLVHHKMVFCRFTLRWVQYNLTKKSVGRKIVSAYDLIRRGFRSFPCITDSDSCKRKIKPFLSVHFKLNQARSNQYTSATYNAHGDWTKKTYKNKKQTQYIQCFAIVDLLSSSSCLPTGAFIAVIVVV